MSNLYFSFGSTWRKEDITWLRNFFRANELTPETAAKAGFALGRRPDSVLIKMRQENMAKVGYNCRYETLPPLLPGVMNDDWVCYFKDNPAETVLQRFPDRLAHADVLHFYEQSTLPQKDKPSVCKPDDRILYLSCGTNGEYLAASFSWADIAERGISEKRVIDMNAEAKEVWNALSPFEQAILKAAIKEGKV